MQNSKKSISCKYFSDWRCRSCSLLAEPDPLELPELPSSLLALCSDIQAWVRCTNPFGSRAKAKLSVTGTVQRPIIGILDADLQGVELLRCPLHKMLLNDAFALLPQLLSQAGLTPYSIADRSGELKNIILQTNDLQNHLFARFVLKSENDLEKVARIGEALEDFMSCELSVSANVQPIPHQIIEGPTEYHIFGETLLWEEYGQTAVAFPARAFMQVTPEVAGALYQRVAGILSKDPPRTLLDLYCGAGGFALSAAPFCKAAYGIELSEAAVEAAALSAEENGIENASFVSADLEAAVSLMQEICPDVVVCNPPRRGLSREVIRALLRTNPAQIIYSSCNSESLTRDIQSFSEHYDVVTLTPFEMFPLTRHYEILAVLQRK